MLAGAAAGALAGAGVYELVDWVSQEQRIRDDVVAAVDELATRGLVR